METLKAQKRLLSQHNLNIPRTLNKAGDQAFSVAGLPVWNGLNMKIGNSKLNDLLKAT